MSYIWFLALRCQDPISPPDPSCEEKERGKVGFMVTWSWKFLHGSQLQRCHHLIPWTNLLWVPFTRSWVLPNSYLVWQRSVVTHTHTDVTHIHTDNTPRERRSGVNVRFKGTFTMVALPLVLLPKDDVTFSIRNFQRVDMLKYGESYRDLYPARRVHLYGIVV